MRMQQYSAKPRTWRKFGKAPYYLGVELEVIAPDEDSYRKGKNYFGDDRKDGQQALMAKRDGSLGSEIGWEIVTKPISFDWWSWEHSAADKFFRLVGELRRLGYTSHDNEKCGLHIHVSREAFGPVLQTPHFYWFHRLVNGPLMFKLSQRKIEQVEGYARQRPAFENSLNTCTAGGSWSTFGHNSDRYVACNVTSHTVEVRIFRGNLRKDRIKKAIETVVAMIEFARHRSWFELHQEQDELEKAFVAWVMRRPGQYPNLQTYLLNMVSTSN